MQGLDDVYLGCFSGNSLKLAADAARNLYFLENTIQRSFSRSALFIEKNKKRARFV